MLHYFEYFERFDGKYTCSVKQKIKTKTLIIKLGTANYICSLWGGLLKEIAPWCTRNQVSRVKSNYTPKKKKKFRYFWSNH